MRTCYFFSNEIFLRGLTLALPPCKLPEILFRMLEDVIWKETPDSVRCVTERCLCIWLEGRYLVRHNAFCNPIWE